MTDLPQKLMKLVPKKTPTLHQLIRLTPRETPRGARLPNCTFAPFVRLNSSVLVAASRQDDRAQGWKGTLARFDPRMGIDWIIKKK
jgi:hypothetical protein